MNSRRLHKPLHCSFECRDLSATSARDGTSSAKSCLPWLISGLLLVLSVGFSGPDLQARDLRLPDDRPQLDVEELEACGLRILKSKRLILVTDESPDRVQDLPLLADALFEELQRQLGALRPDVAGSEFQVTGYLINAKERFEKARLLPPEQYPIRHGRHLGYQFWMNSQTSPYYLRHLLLHEFVHCFMSCEYGMNNIPPLWYTEGIAEYFATHQLDEDVSRSRFGILPPSVDGFEGWGRIHLIREALTVAPAGDDRPSGYSPLNIILHPPNTIFLEDLQYAHAWALVWLIRHHPELRPHFAKLGTVRSYEEFEAFEKSVPEEIWKRMAIVWPLYLDSLIEGFDTDRAFPALDPEISHFSNPLKSTVSVKVESDREWQPAGLALQAGQEITLKSHGRYAVHDRPRPWISEPQGITIDYEHGRPLGEITAMVVSPNGTSAPRRIAVGTELTLSVSEDAELWLQINDSAARRSGNDGTAEVQIERH